MIRRIWLVAVVILGVIALSSCAALNVNALPLPGKTYSGGYDIVIEFENTLNLPDSARVVLDGTTVGDVTKVALTSRFVEVTARIHSHISVPSNVHAALQQATVLGDIYVALERSPETDHQAAPALGPGGKIPLTQTTTPPPLEATIANLANFVSSGSFQRIQNAMIQLNQVQPAGGQPALRKMMSQVATDVEDLGENINVVDQLLNSVSETGEVAHQRIPSFVEWFSPKGMNGIRRAISLSRFIATLLPATGTLWAGGYWLVPLLNSVSDAFGALQHSKWAFQDEYPAWQHLLTNFFLPQDKDPAINITSITGPDGRELSGNLQDVLRILGASR